MNCSFVGMNYLAHAYLSFNSPEILVGNMISDFVKGRSKLGFSGNIQNGIMLHRNIDEFTDNHYSTKKAKEFFRPAYRLYSGALIDVLYDHYLANDPLIFSETSLKEFTSSTYKTLEDHSSVLPERFLHVFTYMKTQDWLFNYRYKEGIRKTLSGLIRRATYLSESETAFDLFNEHYSYLGQCYAEFIQDVKLFAKQRFDDLKG